MKKYIFLVAIVAMLGAGSLFAQATASDTFTVNADVVGIFNFTVANTLDATKIYNFGNVDASTPTITRTGVLNWACNSAPRRTVSISMAASKPTGLMALGALEVRLPQATVGATGGQGTSTGWQAAAAGPVPMLTGVANVGNGTNNARGDIDLQLSIADTDAIGGNSWSVTLTASGT